MTESIRVGNVGITARDFARTVAFYRDVLELAVHFESDTAVFFRGGTVFLVVIDADKSEPQFAPDGRGIWLDVYVPDLAGVRERLVAAGREIAKEWQDDGRKFLVTTDPEGNLLEFVEG